MVLPTIQRLAAGAYRRALPTVQQRPAQPWIDLVLRIVSYLLIAVAPLSVMVAIGPPVLSGLAPGYAQPVLEPSDAVALLFVLAAAAARRGADENRQPRFTKALFILAGLGLLTSPFALSPPLAAFTALRWSLAAAVGWALVRAPLSGASASLVLCAGLLPHLAAAIGQTALQRPLGWPGELTLPLSAPNAAVIGAGETRWLRAYGLTFHPNVLGGYLGTAIVLALPSLGSRAAWAIWTGLCAGLFLTFSRSAWLASALALPITARAVMRSGTVMLRRRVVMALAVGGAVLLCGAWLLSAQLGTRFTPLSGANYPGAGAERQSLSDRADMASVAWAAMRAHPLTGIGAGNFPLEMARRHTAADPQYVHDVPLLLAAEVGVLGGVVWIGAWLAGVVALLRLRRRGAPHLIAALAAWCGLGVIGLFDCYPWSLQSGRLLTALTLALIDVSLGARDLQPGLVPLDASAGPPPLSR